MIYTTLGLLLALPGLALGASRPKNAILLSDVESLTLRGNGAMTAHRRVPAIPQLKCTSSRAICDLYDIDVMRCANQGSSYGDEDIQWSCTATLPEELKLGTTDVICEGYSSPDDPYILKGSCGVEYSLRLTRKGEHRYPDLAGGASNWFSWFFLVVFVSLLCLILVSACRQSQQTGDTRRPRFSGGGWGPGGWGPGNDPPPPYPGTKPSGQEGWTPGFWSGVAGGAAAGYMAGSRNQNNGHNNGYGSFGRSHRWGSGSSSGRRSSSGSSNQHESTGFGSTSRR